MMQDELGRNGYEQKSAGKGVLIRWLGEGIGGV